MKLLDFNIWADTVMDEIIDGGLSRNEAGKLLANEFKFIFNLGITKSKDPNFDSERDDIEQAVTEALKNTELKVDVFSRHETE